MAFSTPERWPKPGALFARRTSGGPRDVSFYYFKADEFHFFQRDSWVPVYFPAFSPADSRPSHGIDYNRAGRVPGSIREFQSGRQILAQYTDKKFKREDRVGLIFNAALGDATEHWKWYHWYFDDSRPIQNFSWNRRIKSGETKRLSWDNIDLKFEHGGGVAFVLTSALFDDGSIWEESPDHAICKYIWYNNHKKALVRPVVLPFRE